MKKLFLFLYFIVISGCATYGPESMYANYWKLQNPSADNNYIGRMGTEPFTSPKDAMKKNCFDGGGLNEASVVHRPADDFLGLEVYDYKCNFSKTSSVSTEVKVIKNNSTLSFDKAKTQCISLGFKEKTEKFGNCVLELTK
jgi:hypothetical protein